MVTEVSVTALKIKNMVTLWPRTSAYPLLCADSLELAQNIVLAEEVELLTSDLNSVSSILGQENLVTGLENHRRLSSVLQNGSGSHSQNLTLKLLLLHGVG